MKHNDRREFLLAAALKVAEKRGYQKVTRELAANEAGVSPGLVQYHFNSMGELRHAMIKEAVRLENIPVLAQALGQLHPDATAAPEELQEKAFNYIKKGVL